LVALVAAFAPAVAGLLVCVGHPLDAALRFVTCGNRHDALRRTHARAAFAL